MEVKDSGERRKFNTGAVRDIQEGKGRFDLMPLGVAARMVNQFGPTDEVIFELHVFEQTLRSEHLYNALWRFCARRYESNTPTMLLEVAKHFEEGAKKYGENNWQKGLPESCYIDSAIRHYLKWLRGDTDEPHDRAFVWNIMCLIWEHDYSKRAYKAPSIDEWCKDLVVDATRDF